MRQTNWTPGPWTEFVSSHANDKTKTPHSYTVYAIDSPHRSVASINWASGVDAEDAANARLIAKSPEMAELLRAYANGDYHDAAAGLMAAFDEAVERLLNELGPR